MKTKSKVISPSSSGVYSTVSNLTPTNTANIRAALKSSSSFAIAFMGDSTMRGVDEGSIPYNAQYSKNSMPIRLAVWLNNYGLKSNANNWYGLSGSTLNDYVIRDSRISVTNGAVDSTIVQGGAGFAMTAASSLSFTCTTPCNTADFYMYDFFAGATVSYQVDGGTATNVAQVGNNTIKKTTIALGTSGIHTVTINWVSGSNSLFGIDCYNNNTKEIILRQWGISGATTASMIDDSGTTHAGRLTQMANFPPKLVISECGLVNSWRTSRSVANSTTDMTTLVNAVKADGSDFIFLTPPYDNSGTGNANIQGQYVQAMYSLSQSLNVPLIDIRTRHQSFPNATYYGWQRASDAVHPSNIGYDDEAQVIANILMSLN